MQAMDVDAFVALMVEKFGDEADEFVTDDLAEQGVLQYSDGSGTAFSYGERVIYGGESFRCGNGAGEVLLDDDAGNTVVTLAYESNGSVAVYYTDPAKVPMGAVLNAGGGVVYGESNEGTIATLRNLLG